MSRKINKLVKQKWFTMEEGVEFHVRMFPMSEGVFLFVNKPKELADSFWMRFNYCLLEWKGIVDDNDKPVPCDEENKREMFDYDDAAMLFVIECVNSFKSQTIADEKKTS